LMALLHMTLEQKQILCKSDKDARESQATNSNLQQHCWSREQTLFLSGKLLGHFKYDP